MPTPQSDIDLTRIRAIAGAHMRSEQQARIKAAAVLHDHIAQALVAARLKVALLRNDHDTASLPRKAQPDMASIPRKAQPDIASLPRKAQPDIASLEFITVRLDEALDLVRTLSRTLAPPVALRDMPLDAAMRWFIRDTHERRGRELILSTPELGASTAGSSGSIDPVARFALFEALDTIIERAPIQTMPTLRISMTSDVGQLAIAIDVPDTIDLSELTERAGWCGVRIELVPGSPMKCVLTVRRFADPRRTPDPLPEGQHEAALTTSSSPI